MTWQILFHWTSSHSNGTYSFTEGTAKIVDASEPAKLEVRFFEGKSKQIILLCLFFYYFIF